MQLTKVKIMESLQINILSLNTLQTYLNMLCVKRIQNSRQMTHKLLSYRENTTKMSNLTYYGKTLCGNTYTETVNIPPKQ